mgnify:CR=1 FL=1
MDENELANVSLPLHYRDSEGLKTRYANNLIVQHSDNEFVLRFYETLPPVIFGGPDEVQKQVDQLTHVDAECVASVIISPNRIPAFIKALQSNYEKYQADNENGSSTDV